MTAGRRHLGYVEALSPHLGDLRGGGADRARTPGANLAWRIGSPTYSVTAHATDIVHCQIRVQRVAGEPLRRPDGATVSRSNRDCLPSVAASTGDRDGLPTSGRLGENARALFEAEHTWRHRASRVLAAAAELAPLEAIA